MKVQEYILYKIYYAQGLMYLGRTRQPLQNRIRGHLFQKPMHRSIDINLVTKIEYAEFLTESDMFIYEIYYINKLKPPLNVDDRAEDDVTVILPEVEFKEFTTHLWDSWSDSINKHMSDHEKDLNKWRTFSQRVSILRAKKRSGEITDDEWQEAYEDIRDAHKEIEKRLWG